MTRRVRRGATPKVGRTYERIPHGQGLGTVLEVERKGRRWTRVRVVYASGCMFGPPPDRPDAPREEWQVPEDEVWIDRADWGQLELRMLPEDDDTLEDLPSSRDVMTHKVTLICDADEKAEKIP